MGVLLVPTFSEPIYTQSTTLEGTQYSLYFAFNQRECCWYMSLADADGVDIYNGIKLCCNFLLLRKCADIRSPPGQLIMISSTADTSPATSLDLVAGGRCALYYITSDWMAQIYEGNAASLVAQVAANTQSTSMSLYGSD